MIDIINVFSVILIFLLCLIFNCFYFFKKAWMKCRFQKALNKNSESMLLKLLDVEALLFLYDLYAIYPSFVACPENSPVVFELDRCSCIDCGALHLSRKHREWVRKYCLKPWVKKCIDNNRDWFMLLIKERNDCEW